MAYDPNEPKQAENYAALKNAILAAESTRQHSWIVSGLPKYDEEFLKALSTSQDRLQAIEPRNFEELVHDILVAKGYRNAKLIRRSNAPGPDILALGPNDGETQTVVEVKRWKGKVGLDVLRELVYRIDYEQPNAKGLLVTTSSFTADVTEHVEKFHHWRVELVDYRGIMKSLAELLKPRERVFSHYQLSSSGLLFKHLDYVIEKVRPYHEFHTHLHEANHPCQRCGGRVACLYFCHDAGTGGWMDDMDYNYHYHICRQCNFALQNLQAYTLDLWDGDTKSNCPFCEQADISHYSWDEPYGNIQYWVSKPLE